MGGTAVEIMWSDSDKKEVEDNEKSPEVPIKILIVTESSINFSRSHFGLSTLLETMLYPKEWWVRFELTLAHRRLGGHDSFWDFLDIPPPPKGNEGEQQSSELLKSYYRNMERLPGFFISETQKQMESIKDFPLTLKREFKKMIAIHLNQHRFSRSNSDLPRSREELFSRYQRVLLEGVESGWQFLDGFRFSDESLLDFDEIWLFGIAKAIFNRLETNELHALKKKMNSGTGVFACGDHGKLGSSLCGEIPRVRLMQRWHDSSPPPELGVVNLFQVPRNTLMGGRDNPRTMAIDESKVIEETDQSDDVPALLEVTPYRNYHHGVDGEKKLEQFNRNIETYPHHVFSCGKGTHPNGTIDQFPDHMHEGEVVVPCSCGSCKSELVKTEGENHLPFQCNKTWKMAQEAQKDRIKEINKNSCSEEGLKALKGLESLYSGEWPRNKHTKCPLPWDVSAWGQSSVSLQKNSDLNGWGSVKKSRFGVVGTYNGHIAEGDIGRILVDSTFHHWVDVNLTGIMNVNYPRSSLFVNDLLKWFGFLTPDGIASLNQIRAYHRNVALWLAPKNKQKEMATKALWLGIISPPFAEIPEFFQIVETQSGSEFAKSIRRLGQRIINSFSEVIGEVQVRSFWVSISIGTPVEKLPFYFEALEAPQRQVIDELFLGGIVFHLASFLIDSRIDPEADLTGEAEQGLLNFGLTNVIQYARDIADDIPTLLDILIKLELTERCT